MDEQHIKMIYLNCNRTGVDMEELLRLCLDPDSGITVQGLKEANYKKIDQLEQRYILEVEDATWRNSQSSAEALTKYIDKVNRGVFSTVHLDEAKEKLQQLSAAAEMQEWNTVSFSKDLSEVIAFIAKIKSGTYSKKHLDEALSKAELMDWEIAKNSNDSVLLNAYIQKCQTGFYPFSHEREAKQLLEEWESGAIIEDWKKVMAEQDLEKRVLKANQFKQEYAYNPSETAKAYIEKADKEVARLADEEKALVHWNKACQSNQILDYVQFINQHPYSDYREEAESRIRQMKGELLTDMKRYPFKYDREMMYAYISNNVLTMADLVDDSHTLTDRAYSHIKTYPTLKSEQRVLPFAQLENPTSETGNTDIYFFGVSGSGKTCVLAGLMSLTGRLGFKFDPKGPGGGGNYAMDLRKYARTSTLPPATDQQYIQVIDAEINDEANNLHKISLIEMSGEKTARFAALNNSDDLEDLGQGASGLLLNNNNKVLFFVIDPTNEKYVEMGEGSQQWVMQSDVLNCVSSLLSKKPGLMKKVVAIHIILTKSDTLGDFVDNEVLQEVLDKQGYQAVLDDIKEICDKYSINKQTGFQVGLFPFCIGKFLPGEVYTFDETDSLKILRVIQNNTGSIKTKKSFWDKLGEFFNS